MGKLHDTKVLIKIYCEGDNSSRSFKNYCMFCIILFNGSKFSDIYLIVGGEGLLGFPDL